MSAWTPSPLACVEIPDGVDGWQFLPIYVPSKGRPTSKMIETLTREGIPFTTVLEAQDVERYSLRTPVHVLPESNRGLAFVRNYICGLSESRGETWHWQIDDDIDFLALRMPKKKLVRLTMRQALAIMESRTLRFSNVALAGAMENQFPPSGIEKNWTPPMQAMLLKNDPSRRWGNVSGFEDRHCALETMRGGNCVVAFDFIRSYAPKPGTNSGSLSASARRAKRDEFIGMWPNIEFNNTGDQGGRPKMDFLKIAFPQTPLLVGQEHRPSIQCQPPNDFCVLILTHGRPDNVLTYKSLERHGYTGPVYFLVDNDDSSVPEYVKRFGADRVVVFDKAAEVALTDSGTNDRDRRAIVYARNHSYSVARRLGYRYFLQLDDDYTWFYYKHNERLDYCNAKVLSLNGLFDALLGLLKSVPTMRVLAMAQGGDFIGGEKGVFAEEWTLHRKAMNTFFCDTERPFRWAGKMNEDVSAYVRAGETGMLFVTVPNVMITQVPTQKGKGGMSEFYLQGGTYTKSFYSVMFSPSCVKVTDMGTENKRLHHRIFWDNAAVAIVPESCRKA